MQFKGIRAPISGPSSVGGGISQHPAAAEPRTWRLSALCAQVDPELFFPDKGEPARAALRVCAACPVRVQCLEDALTGDQRYGVWGGTTEIQRRRLRKQRTAATTADGGIPGVAA